MDLLRGVRPVLRTSLRRRLIELGYHSRPHFLIIGAQKAGTTALYYYLAGHPDIILARDKEIGFFSPEIYEALPDHPHHAILWRSDGSIFVDARAYAQAATWYHGWFPLPHVLRGRRLTGEATPEYLYFPDAAQRIFEYDPRMRLIVLLRDPVERAFSAWNMYHNFDDPIYSRIREERTFERAICDELNEFDDRTARMLPGYVRRGLYAEQLRRYFELFGRDQLLWIDSRRLRTDTAAVVGEVVRFLGLATFPPGGRAWPPMHVGRYEGTPPAASVDILRDFFRPHNQQLYELLNYDFGW